MVRSNYKKIKKDYQPKNLYNPFFREKNKKRETYHGKARYFLILAAGLLAIWFFLDAPLWRLQEIKVTGLTRLNSSELERIVWDEAKNRSGLIFRENNLFLFRGDVVASKIVSIFNFSAVSIIKKWPHTLELNVSERPYAFIYQEGSVYTYASADAYIIKEPPVSETDMKKYFILENKSAQTLIIGGEKINIKAEYLNYIFDLNQRLSIYPELPVEKFIIDQEFNTVKVKFIAGPLAFFSIKEASVDQINRLLLVKREKIKDNFSKTNYIDLRYGATVFINPDFK